MRRLTALVAFAMLALPALAADRTLLSDDDVWKLYTEPSVKVTTVNGNSATIGAIGIGAILNEQLNVGIEADGLVNDIKLDDSGDVNVRAFDWWYAGATIGYTFFASDLLHVHVGSLFGGGQLHTHPEPSTANEESVAYAVVEPRVTLYINLSETVELGLGASYRFVNGFNLPGVNDNDMSTPCGFLSVRVSEF